MNANVNLIPLIPNLYSVRTPDGETLGTVHFAGPEDCRALRTGDDRGCLTFPTQAAALAYLETGELA